MSASRLRILAGSYGGRRLEVGPGVRPTESRVREALFGIWQQRVVDSRFLDLFAGSGAVGLEALSRGAASSLLVEGKPGALAVLQRNRLALADPRASIRRGHLPDWLTRRPSAVGERPFDLVFADPPYRFAAYDRLLSMLPSWLAPSGVIAIEHSARRELPELCDGAECCDRRGYGETSLSFYQSLRSRA